MSSDICYWPEDHTIHVYCGTYSLFIKCRPALQTFSVNDFKKMIRIVITQLKDIRDKYRYLDSWEAEIKFLAENIKFNQPEWKAKPMISRLIKFTDYINKQRDKLPPKYL